MSRISDILSHKDSDVLTIPMHATAHEAVQKMVEKNVGSILVTDECGTATGIFTERDYLRRVVLENRPAKMIPVHEVMSDHLITTSPIGETEDCMRTMTNHRIRHVPVIDRGRLVGIVSIGDVVKHLLDEKGHEVKHLTDYITGQYPGELGPCIF